jgi:hypothetical protein
MEPQLAPDLLDMVLGRPFRNEQALGYLSVGQPLGYESGDLPLARCQRRFLASRHPFLLRLGWELGTEMGTEACTSADAWRPFPSYGGGEPENPNGGKT